MVASTARRDELRNAQPESELRNRQPKCDNELRNMQNKDDHRHYDTKCATKTDTRSDATEQAER
eukprot:9477325-Pyramimonas_sp.AAC.1